MTNKKVALITGITGQDGSYLAEFLLEKGYEVHGIKRRASSFNTQRIDHIFQDPHKKNPSLFLHYGDLTDSSNLTRILTEVEPDEVYNLAAQSHVAVSFEVPEYTADVVAIGTLRLLEAIRFLGLEKKTRFYQASTSELFGDVQEIPQTVLDESGVYFSGGKFSQDNWKPFGAFEGSGEDSCFSVSANESGSDGIIIYGLRWDLLR